MSPSTSSITHPRTTFPTLDLTPAPTTEPQRVLVLGAGMAGMSAAMQLVLKGHDVSILEARDRPGGRVHTVRAPFRYGQHAEAGAMYVYSPQSLTMGYCRHFGLTLDEIPPGDDHQSTYYVEGVKVPNPNAPDANWLLRLTEREQQLGLKGMFNQYVQPVVDELGDPRGVDWPPEPFQGYDTLTTSAFLAERGASEAAIRLLRMGFLDEWGDGSDTTSALFILRDLDFYKDGVPTHRMPHLHVAGSKPVSYTIHGGTDRLAEAFAASPELTGRIRYGHEVLAIGGGEGEPPRVSYSAEGRTDTESADHVICTIPFSVLRELELPSWLSPMKRRVIEGLRYTSVVRVFLQFQRRFWDEGHAVQYVFTDLPVMGLNHQTITQPGPAGILEAVVTGPYARMFSAMGAEARLDSALEQYRMIYPDATEAYIGGASKSWDEDPWARGDWCWFAPGEFTEFWPHLGSREGNLHFAGEHTSALPGWMQGAFESGHRAAAEVDLPGC